MLLREARQRVRVAGTSSTRDTNIVCSVRHAQDCAVEGHRRPCQIWRLLIAFGHHLGRDWMAQSFRCSLFININGVGTRLYRRHPESYDPVLPFSPLAIRGNVTRCRHPTEHALRIVGRSPPLAMPHAGGDRAPHIRFRGERVAVREDLKFHPPGRIVPKSEAAELCER